jgi:hypothetical protein
VWPQRVAFGKLTLFMGDPGVGKTFLTLDIAARVTRGSALPDGGHAPEGRVLVFSGEDNASDTIRPRIQALGGNVERVYVPRQGDGLFTIDSLDAFRVYLRETHVQLVVLDPLSAFLGRRTDSYRDADVRALLTPLVQFAEEARVAIVATLHLTKDEERRALHRAQGSIAFVAAARAVFLVAREGKRSIVASVKTNLSAPPPALAFSLREGRVEWHAEPVPEATTRGLLGLATGPGEALDEPATFLREFLAAGSRLAAEVLRVGREQGFSPDALKRAKSRAGVESVKTRFDGQWAWKLREPTGDRP